MKILVNFNWKAGSTIIKIWLSNCGIFLLNDLIHKIDKMQYHKSFKILQLFHKFLTSHLEYIV